MGPLVLAKNFLFLGGGQQVFFSDWMPIDSEYKNATVHVHCQAISPTTLAMGLVVDVESSFDTVEKYAIAAPLLVVAPGSQSTSTLTSDIGPWVRLRLLNGDAVPMGAVVSVWLQPKRT